MSYKQMTGNLISATKLVPTANSSTAYGVATGVWNLQDMYDYKRGGQWPIPAGVPGAPTISGVTAGNTEVDVAFSANNNTGGLAVTSFTATASSGQSASATSSPITVTSLTNDTAITFTVTATNPAGTSAASSASNNVTPAIPASRGIFYSGTNAQSQVQNTIDYITVASAGNATDFGDADARQYYSGCASSTRALFNNSNSGIDYLEIATTGNKNDFGSGHALAGAALSNGVYGIFAGGISVNTIKYVTIASTGNAASWGDLQESGHAYYLCGAGGSTRGIISSGATNNGVSKLTQYLTFGTSGNTSDFGDLHDKLEESSITSNGTRVCIMAGNSGTTGAKSNTIEYAQLASAGNFQDFGDLSAGRVSCHNGNVSSTTRGIIGGGSITNNKTNVIEYITFSSTGNMTDFGDMTSARGRLGGASTFGGT